MKPGVRRLSLGFGAMAMLGAWSFNVVADQLFITPGNANSTNADAQILQFDSQTGSYSGVLSPSQGLDSFVYGLTLGSDGFLYGSYFDWSDEDGRVLRISLTGAVETFVSAGSTAGDWPTGLTFGPDGNLYVANLRPGNVLRYDGTTGAFIDVFVSGLSSPQDIVFGPDGNLYVSGGSSDSISRFDGSTGAFLGYIVAPGASGPIRTTGMAFGPNGDLYVASFVNDNIFRFDGLTGALVSTFDLSYDATVKDVIFGPDGNLYATITVLGPSTAIVRLDPDSGALIDQFSVLPSSRLFETGMLFVDPACSSLGSVEGATSGCFSGPVLTVSQRLAALSEAVAGVGSGKSLTKKVQLAQAYYAAGDIQATCAVLADLVSTVNGMTRGKRPKLSAEIAAQLISDAEVIITAIGCS